MGRIGRVLLLTPAAPPSVGGNAVTVGRLRAGFRARGVAADVVDLSRTPSAALAGGLGAPAPAVVHAFHAFRAGPAATALARAQGVPLVVSLTGTDVNHDLFDSERRAATVAAIRQARALIAFHETIRDKLARELPEAGSRIRVIPQSVVLGDAPFPLSSLVPRRRDEVLFLLPAGIRRVKNVLLPFGPLGMLGERLPIRLLIAGPIIEEVEGARLLAALKGADWATYLGEVPHAQMASLLAQVDVVLNSSISEGGMANSVLEAMSLGKAVLASDIEGNRSVIEPEVDGLLFRSADELFRQAERLACDPGLRRRLGEAARAKASALGSADREIDGYLALYREVVG